MGGRGTAGNTVHAAGNEEGHQEKDERLVCSLCNAYIQPYTVVIKVAHTSVADAAVFGLVLDITAAAGKREACAWLTNALAPAPLAELPAVRFGLRLIIPHRISNIGKCTIRSGGERHAEAALPQCSEHDGRDCPFAHGPSDEPKRSVKETNRNPADNLMRVKRALTPMIPAGRVTC